MKKCDCYKTIEKVRYNAILSKYHYKTVGICNGTKEQDECSCGGDRAKCDFYDYVREEAKQELEKNIPTYKCLVIAFDNSQEDDTVLIVSKNDGKSIEILKTFYNEEALDMYKRLVV